MSFLNEFLGSPSDWSLAAVIAVVIYGVLVAYLGATHHMTFAGTASSGAGCVDHREDVKYRVPGGVGTYSLGLVPWLLYVSVFPEWSWLVVLARVQFLMSVVDILLLWGQLLFKDPGREFVLLRSHGLRHPGCGRTSAWEPIGASLYLLQIFTGWKWLGYVRGLVQLPYDLVGWLPALIINLPMWIFGKFIIPIPF